MNDKPETSVSEQHTDETATNKTTEGSVTFTPEQQRHINKLVDKAASRMNRKHRDELAKLQAERDAAAGGTLEESELVTKLRAERDAAQERLRGMERARSEAIAKGTLTKAWNQAGLVDNPEWRDSTLKSLTKLDDDGEIVFLDLNGNESFGVDAATFMRGLGEKFPKLRADYQEPGNDANPKNPSGGIRSKADLKTSKEKSDYITKFGYDAWAALPTARPQSKEPDPETDVLRWTNDQKAEYLRSHTQAELSELFRVARAKERTRR